MGDWTPGPWAVTRSGVIAVKPGTGPGRYRASVAMVAIKGREPDDFWLSAKPDDARLIAAAPMLAEALTPFARAADGYSERVTDSFVIDEFDDTADGGEHWKITLGDCRRARAALAAAKGEAK